MNPKEAITSLIAEGKLEEAVALWRTLISREDSIQTDLVGYSARLEGIASARNQGRISFNEEMLQRSAVASGMLDTLKKWRSGGGFDQLEDAIQQLGIDADNDMAAIHLVNCDRVGQAKTFRRVFNQRDGKSDFQFYFICACPNEMPSSFGKRLIYAIINDRLNGKQDAISYPFQEETDTIKIENLPIADDVPGSRERLKKYVAQRFHFSDTQSFETFIETGVPRLPYDYVTSVFEISEKIWEGDEGEISQYFEWMLETFRCPNKGVPTFLFFIVVKSPGLWENPEGKTSRQKTILNELGTLCEKYPEQATLMSNFPPIDQQDFDDWVADIDGIRNPNHSRAVTSALAATFKPGSPEDKLYQQEQKFHLKDIEPLQKRIFDIASK
ncbi:MAG: hypothetical protein IT261_09260 [Saprospiraceae bacterium]|nr:hypothetical protein [Saprospiraceae bacterium]